MSQPHRQCVSKLEEHAGDLQYCATRSRAPSRVQSYCLWHFLKHERKRRTLQLNGVSTVRQPRMHRDGNGFRRVPRRKLAFKLRIRHNRSRNGYVVKVAERNHSIRPPESATIHHNCRPTMSRATFGADARDRPLRYGQHRYIVTPIEVNSVGADPDWQQARFHSRNHARDKRV